MSRPLRIDVEGGWYHVMSRGIEEWRDVTPITTVFRDPKAASLYDDEHSKTEDRWVTLGLSAGNGLLVVHHTFEQIDADHASIRIFSCRKATPNQIRQYGE